tara:strand:+ start:72 stop:500 length:429 start_codon:yes stop_codon:yes gene_type:complete
MKRFLFILFSILLTSCSSLESIFSPIQTIKCKQIKSGVEFPFQPKTDKSKVIIFNKNTGELFFYDTFFETLKPISERDAKWIKSTIINGKLKIHQGDKRVWGKAIIDLKDLKGEYLYINSQYKEIEWDLKCIKVKNLSSKIK